MKIKVTTQMRQPPEIEIDGKSILGMEYWQRLKLFNDIMNKIPELPNWFEEFLLAICFQFGEELQNENIFKFTQELDL